VTTVKDLMTRDVVFLTPNQTVVEAAKKMKALNVGVIPIADNDQRLLGLITDRDIVIRVIAEDRDPAKAKLQDYATMDPVAAQPEWRIQDAARMMEEYQIRRLPVVENGKLTGILSLGDLAVQQPSEQLSGKVLEAVSEPAQPQRGAIKESEHIA